MNYNTNILYNNYTTKNPSKRGYQTQPFGFYQSPPYQHQSKNTINSNQIPYKNMNSTNRSNYNNQTIFSPKSKNSLKWRNIMKINLPQLKNTRDLTLLQSNLDNLVFGDVTEEDIQSLPEVNIVKLVQILQTSCDILLNEQQELENEMMKIENENIQIINDFKMKEKNFLKNKDLICRLKKEKKRDISVLNTYQNVIKNLKNNTYYNLRNINTNITDVNITNRSKDNLNVNSNRQGEFKCEHCPGKNFMTEFELHKHLSEVHGINKLNNKNNQNQINQVQNPSPIINIQYPPNFYNNNENINNNDQNFNEYMKKLDDIKKDFQETFIKQHEENKRLLEEQRQKDTGNNNQKILEKFENTFKETMNNFKSMIENQNQNNNQPNIIIQDNGVNNDDNNEWKKREILRLNEELNNKKKELFLQEDNYQKQIKELENSINILNIEIIQNKKFKEDEELISNKNINHNSNIQINRPIRYQANPIKLPENRPKSNFNSGKIVSDHDETDEELKNKQRILELYNNDKDIITQIINRKTVITQTNQIPQNTINQDNFFDMNKRQNDMIPEVSQGLEISNNNDNIINTNINRDHLRTGEIIRKNKALDNYYRRYIKRDKNYLLEPEFSNYFIDTLPKDFDLDPQINENANDLAKEKIKMTGNEIFPNNVNIIPEVEEDQLKTENIDDLTMLMNSLVNNMDKKNTDKNGKMNDYYLSIKEVLGFGNMIKTCQNIFNKSKNKIDTKKIIKEENKEELDKDKEKPLEKKNNLLEENKNKNDNINNIQNINTNIEPANKNEIKSGVVLSEIKENDIEEINLDNKDNDNENNTKLRNKQRNNINKGDNYIQNITTNIQEVNTNPNKVIVETTNINQNNNIPLKNKNNEDHLDAPYTSTQSIVPSNNIPQKETQNDKHLDGPYVSTMSNVGNNQSQDNKRADAHLDQPYTSIPSNVNIQQQNQLKTQNLNNMNNHTNNNDVGYSSYDMTGKPIKEANDTNYVSSKNAASPNYNMNYGLNNPNMTGTSMSNNINNNNRGTNYSGLNNAKMDITMTDKSNNINNDNNKDESYTSKMADTNTNINNNITNNINNNANINNNNNEQSVPYYSGISNVKINNNNQNSNNEQSVPYYSGMANVKINNNNQNSNKEQNTNITQSNGYNSSMAIPQNNTNQQNNNTNNNQQSNDNNQIKDNEEHYSDEFDK